MLISYVLPTILASVCLASLQDGEYINQGTNCPKEEEVAPCTCDRYGINCWRAIDGSDIKRAMTARPKNERIFRTFYLTYTDIEMILPRTFEFYSFIIVNMHSNKLRYIGDDAFVGSEDTMVGLTLQNNQLDHVPYEAVQNLRKLQNLVLAYNKITTIPGHVFTKLVSLQGLFLNDNQISYVGPRAFATLADLRILYLSNNRLTTLGEYFLMNPSVHLTLGVLLTNNQISSISPRAFSNVKNIGMLELSQNQLESLNKTSLEPILGMLEDNSKMTTVALLSNPIQCDRRIVWMLDLSTTAKRKIKGMACNGKELIDMLPSDLS